MDTAGHRNAQSNSPRGREIQLTSRFRRWWQVLGSNQRRRAVVEAVARRVWMPWYAVNPCAPTT